MIARRDSSAAYTWARREPPSETGARNRADDLYDEIRRMIDGKEDDAQVTLILRVDDLRLLIEPDSVRAGASIRDEARRVTYNVTLHREEGVPRLRTVEIVPDEDVDDPGVFRVPVSLLTKLASEVLAATDAGYLALGIRDESDGRLPTPQELADLVRAGVTRGEIAARYGRSLGAVDQMLRRARAKLPDAFPPRQRPGIKKPTESQDSDNKN